MKLLSRLTRAQTSHTFGDISLKKQAQARAALDRRTRQIAVRGSVVAALFVICTLLFYAVPNLSLEKNASAEALSHSVASGIVTETSKRSNENIQPDNHTENIRKPTTARVRPSILGYISPRRPRIFHAF